MKLGLLPRFLIILAATAAHAFAQAGHLTVKVDQPGAAISPMLYGLMTEEINHSYDGGLYAELIQNRAFKDAAGRAVHWALIKDAGGDGAMSLDTSKPLNPSLPISLKLRIAKAAAGQRVGVANDGYWGIPVTPKTEYHASFFARSDDFAGPLTVAIESADGQGVYASATVRPIGSAWKRYEVTLTTGEIGPTSEARLVLSGNDDGTIWFSLVSLFPPTFNNRPNGNRIDLMQKLLDMHPAFLRLPGGNYLEGNFIDQRFAWEKTIHGIEQRPGHLGPWGYRSTDGLGLLEFLNWCEDLHMEPVLAVFAGYALRGQHIDAGPKLEPFVREALDEIEYATGEAGTNWGHQRVLDGHPAPFKIHYVEIGNEDEFDRSRSYDGRFAQFFDAIKAKHPDLQLIATTPVRSRVPDVIDDHFYRSSRAMADDVHHYDNIARTGPKVFVGEWASTEGRPTPTLNAALGDAAWMTGMERNSDVVVMSCYAPLLVNVNPGASQWGTNLIGYDALSSFGSPSYYAQKMFSENRGDTVLPVDVTPAPYTPVVEPAPHGGIGVATWATVAEFKDIKVVSGNSVLYQKDTFTDTNGWRVRDGLWSVSDGAMRQTSDRDNCLTTIGDVDWGDYTYTLKARKISGAEGFLIAFHFQDDDTYLWWNLGGWGNTRSAVIKNHDAGSEEIGGSEDVTIQSGRWYDIRIEVKGHDIRCYLDNKLITQAVDEAGPPPVPLAATASMDHSSGEVILKVVNLVPDPQKVEINVQGGKEIAADATAVVLSGDPKDQNTIDEPTKVAPRQISLTDAGRKFTHEFPGYSVTVLRLRPR